MNEYQETPDHEQETRLENELKEIKLQLEYGVKLTKPEGQSELPHETRGEFLDYIGEWERQFALRKMTTVFERAGRPEYKDVNTIADTDIANELDVVMDQLLQCGIKLQTLCDVDERELYRFVTQELINEEIQDIRIEGMTTSFIYEDFYPNHSYDIKNRCDEFVQYLADLRVSPSLISWCLSDNLLVNGLNYTKEDFDAKLAIFKLNFTALSNNECSYHNLLVNEQESMATVTMFLQYSGSTENGQDTSLAGNFTLNLANNFGWWEIVQVELPWNI